MNKEVAMRIAVVSRDRKNVDERFGRAHRFLIFDENKEELHYVGERLSEPLIFAEEAGFDREMFAWIAEIIQDCDLVVSTAICAKPAQELRRLGIIPVEYQGSIASLLALNH